MSGGALRTFKAALLIACAGVAITPSAVSAQSNVRRSYDIPSQDLGAALTELGRQAGREIHFMSSATRGKRSAALQGSFTFEAALDRLLDGSRLSWRASPSGAVVVQEVAAADEEPTKDELNPNAPDNQTIMVIGSRIPRPQYEGNFPGSQVTAAQIEARGFTHLYDVLNEVPIMAPTSANPYGIGGAQIGGITSGGLATTQPIALGVSFSNMLGLGTQRTLTLVNGRRFVSGNSATQYGPGGAPGNQVDLSVIPAALVSRIDMLAVGGAAVYGSDGVGGVINIVLKDDYEGITINGNNSISHEGDLPTYAVTLFAGTNFAEGRGNISGSLQYSFWSTELQQARREYRAHYLGNLLNVFNGTRRNPGFVPSLTINSTLNNGAFLAGATDGQQALHYINRGVSAGSVILSDGGTVFLPTSAGVANMGVQGMAVTSATPTQNGSRPLPSNPPVIGLMGNPQIIPYGPVEQAVAGCSPTLNTTTFCRFAPSALPNYNPPGPPGTPPSPNTPTAQQIIARFAPTFNTAGATQAQLDTLALNLLQANLPTIGEYFSANPNTDINLIAAWTGPQPAPGGGSPTAGLGAPTVMPTVANTDPATSALFPRVARPIRFDNQGNLVAYTIARPQANEYAGTYNQAVGGDFLRNDDQLLMRVQQEKKTATLFAHFDVTDNLTVYTENIYADIVSTSPRRVDTVNFNFLNNTEFASLVMNYNNPFLDTADRTTLRSVGICPTNLGTASSPCFGPNFMVNRTNVDINEDTPQVNRGETIRTLLGLKGEFGLLGRSWNFDMAGAYGRVDQFATSSQIRDIEYALAVDAVLDTSGAIRCRRQLQTQSSALPPGVAALEVVREKGADGIITEKLVTRAVTPEQVAACVPLNVFGYNQMSQAAKDYVRAQLTTSNLSEQYFAESSLSGSLVDLPAGPLGVAFVAEWRKDSFVFEVDELSRIGATRLPAYGNTEGSVQTIELGAEARIPIFGDDFNIPLFRNLDISPAIRYYKATGSAPDIRRLNGNIEEQRYNSGWNRIWSLAGTWRPVEDLAVRASYTSSIRAPSVVELFLGGQPHNTPPGDPCKFPLIDTPGKGPTRRNNCEAAVIALGIKGPNGLPITTVEGAKQFLSTFVAAGPNPYVYGTINGSQEIKPERGISWGIGAVFKPSFVPGLQLSVDYISAKIVDQVSSFELGTAIDSCYDSPTFPDTTANAGFNWCDVFSRSGADTGTPFAIANGYRLAFRNLGTIETEVLSLNGLYNLKLNDIFGGSTNLGNLGLSGQAQYLFLYRASLTNEFKPELKGLAGGWDRYDGTSGQPKWEVQLSANYNRGNFQAGWTTNWQSGGRIQLTGSPADLAEFADVWKTPSFAIHNANVGFQIPGEQMFGINFSVSNVFNKKYTITESAAFGGGIGLVSPIGRTYIVSANVKF